MRKIFYALPLIAAAPLIAQMPPMKLPGAADATRVKAGTYAVEPTHTMVEWQVNHFGFNDYFGIFGEPKGSLTIDPANLGAAKLDVTVPIKNLVTPNAELNKHLASDGFFDAAKFETAKFSSTSVTATKTSAIIKGNLTLKGVTKPITLNAKFSGAGVNPFNKKLTLGFSATGTINRSQFNMGGFVPMVGDKVDLKITAAFEKQ